MSSGANSQDITALGDRSVRAYDHVVSLGPNCAVAFNLRRFFGEQHAFPFDWWATYDALGFASFLRYLDLDKLYDPDELRLGTGNRSVVHTTYRIELYHEFARVSHEEHAPIIPNYLAGVSLARRRTSYLINRTKELSQDGSRLLFVRATEPCEIISRALEWNFPQANWDIAFVGRVQTGSAFDWRGDTSLWDTTLQGMGARLREVTSDLRNGL
jgi:hypothetical protein